jgi:2'-5' RNA ligase
VTGATDRRRLFFAFWPDDPTRAALEAARTRLFPLDGRPVAAADLHVTAAFLGAVSEARVPALLRLATAVPPFELCFDRVDFWPRPKVLVAVSSQSPPRAAAAVDSLWGALSRLGFRRDPRPWRPHVTLARDTRAPRRDPQWPAVSWPVRGLRLVESLPAEAAAPAGARYRTLG